MKPEFSVKTQDYVQAVAACHFSVSLAQHSKAETDLQEFLKEKLRAKTNQEKTSNFSMRFSVSTNPARCTVNQEGSRVQRLRQYTINAHSRNARERQRTASCKTYAESTGRSRRAILLDDTFACCGMMLKSKPWIAGYRWIQQTPVIQLSASANVEEGPAGTCSASHFFDSFDLCSLWSLWSASFPLHAGHTDSPVAGRMLCVCLCWWTDRLAIRRDVEAYAKYILIKLAVLARPPIDWPDFVEIQFAFHGPNGS